MLAIAAPSFNIFSETFIHDHVRMIAPSRTVLLCYDDTNADQFGCPVLAIARWTKPRNSGERALNALRHAWHTYVSPDAKTEHRQRIVDFLRAYKVKAVLAEYGPMGCYVMGACADANVPLHVHFHGFDASLLLRQRHWLRHYNKLFQSSKTIIAPSNFLANKLAAAGCSPAKLHTSYNGISVDLFRATSRQPRRLVAVGRLVEKKAPDLTISAFRKILPIFPDAHLDIVGDGPLFERCKDLIKEGELESSVTLHGAQPQPFVLDLLANASLFVQHSVTAANGDTEGFGISLVEAMACCVPIVTTQHNGFVETVVHGKTGLLVKEHDIEGMANAMTELLSNPLRAAAMGEAGRERVLANFTLAQSSNRLRQIIGIPAKENHLEACK